MILPVQVNRQKTTGLTPETGVFTIIFQNFEFTVIQCDAVYCKKGKLHVKYLQNY